jgi:hypothetical protein
MPSIAQIGDFMVASAPCSSIWDLLFGFFALFDVRR